MAAALAAAEAEAAAASANLAGDYDQDDLVSEAPSMVSGFSMYTDRTATGVGLSSAASSRAASTIGGRKAMKNSKKAAKKGKKIKAGSPQEEASLEELLLSLGPPQHVLEEAGQLTELLVLLQHTADAARLQQRVGQWQTAAAEARDVVLKGRAEQQQQKAAEAVPGSSATAATAGISGVNSTSGAVTTTEVVRWKWDVLREHK